MSLSGQNPGVLREEAPSGPRNGLSEGEALFELGRIEDASTLSPSMESVR